jgi:hypothetical protein
MSRRGLRFVSIGVTFGMGLVLLLYVVTGIEPNAVTLASSAVVLMASAVARFTE